MIADKARGFFAKHGVRLTLTTASNPEANGKIERGHSLIVKALAKACDGRVRDWPRMLPYALWADRTTHSSVTGYMPAEIMIGQAPVMPTETVIATWTVLPWKEEMSREELLADRIRQLEVRPEDIAEEHADNRKRDSGTKADSTQSIGYDRGRLKKEIG